MACPIPPAPPVIESSLPPPRCPASPAGGRDNRPRRIAPTSPPSGCSSRMREAAILPSSRIALISSPPSEVPIHEAHIDLCLQPALLRPVPGDLPLRLRLLRQFVGPEVARFGSLGTFCDLVAD